MKKHTMLPHLIPAPCMPRVTGVTCNAAVMLSSWHPSPLHHTICTSSYPHLSNTREVGPCKNIFGQFLLTALWKWEENSHRIADDRGQELGIKRSCDDTEPRPQLDPARPRISASSHFSSVSFHHISSVSSRAAKTNDFHNRFHQQSAVSCEERRRSN